MRQGVLCGRGSLESGALKIRGQGDLLMLSLKLGRCHLVGIALRRRHLAVALRSYLVGVALGRSHLVRRKKASINW